MNRIRTTLAVTSLTLLAGSAGAAVSFFDGVFNNSDWNEIVFTNADGIGSTTSVGQNISGGNPNEFRFINMTLVSSAPGGAVFSLNLNANAFYNPSSQGYISAIDYSEDSINFLPNSGDGQGTGLLIMQGGKIYIQRNPVLVMPAPNFSNWAPNAAPNLQASDLWELSSTGTLNSSSNPDFTITGGLMQFGFYRGASSGNFVGTGFREAGIDNWNVRILPTPATTMLLGSAGLLAMKRRRPEVSKNDAE
ncbi:MAG: hypothetical protein KC996_09145 [Phycisphaerales bacterium]|nr:hypothetical protein [Phycisphaerales bacterium]